MSKWDMSLRWVLLVRPHRPPDTLNVLGWQVGRLGWLCPKYYFPKGRVVSVPE